MGTAFFAACQRRILASVARSSGSISIICRAVALNVTTGEPLGQVFCPRTKQTKTKVILLQSTVVVRIMRQACIDAYPDPTHYYRLRVHCIARQEPYTQEMYQTLAQQISAATKLDNRASLQKQATVFDWARLSTFTGSRVGEYAQSVGTSTKASRVPDLPFAEEQAGTPIAFTHDDFSFYTTEGMVLSTRIVISHSGQAQELHIRFRYDKSPRNFVIRKFCRSGHSFLCPVKAAISIICRAVALNVTTGEPLGQVFCPRTKQTKTKVILLQSSDVVRIMRQACIDAYPDPTHYYRLRVHCIDAHSGRVTAAVALSNAGVPKEEIAFRLRWQPASVDHYLRDCSKAIGRLTQAAIQGSLLT